MTRLILALAAAAGLGGCAAGSADTAPDAAAGKPMNCDAAKAQSHLGQSATQAVGTAILRDSGARSLRWGPPNGAWTMDYREDRVNVRYDAQMTIIEITCG